jgi:hypothetical protein
VAASPAWSYRLVVKWILTHPTRRSDDWEQMTHYSELDVTLRDFLVLIFA